MDVERRRLVLETSLRTSAEALVDPEPLEALPARVRSTGVLSDADDERPSAQAPPEEEPRPSVPFRVHRPARREAP